MVILDNVWPRDREHEEDRHVATWARGAKWSKTVPQCYRVNEIANQGHDCDKTVETGSFTS